MKVAVTDLLALIVTVQVEAVPVHAPDHPAKVEVASGAADRTTAVAAS